MKLSFLRSILLTALLPVTLALRAAPFMPAPEMPEAEVDRDAPDFVTASLLVIGPGDELYSCAGHAVLRMQCPTLDRDVCFSYECESGSGKLFTFLSGKPKARMVAVPVLDYLNPLGERGLGVMQYRLNLPVAAKRRLFDILDEAVAKGLDLPCDYDAESGISQALLVLLADAAGELSVQKVGQAILPDDLVALLRQAKVDGFPVIDTPGVQLLQPAPAPSKPSVVPIAVALCLPAIAVASTFMRNGRRKAKAAPAR